MPQEVINIKRFGGLYFNPQQEDLPLEASAYSVNVDPHAVNGRLSGIKVNGDAHAAGNIVFAVTNVTNTTPMTVTAPGHPFSNSDTIVIAGVYGCTAANGSWTINAVAGDDFNLIGSTADGAYGYGGTATKAISTAIPDVYEADWIQYDSSGTTKYDLIYIDKDDNDITAIEDFYAAEGSRIFNDLVTTSIAPECIRTFNKEAQIGNGIDDDPRLVHRILTNKGFFNNDKYADAGLYEETGWCRNNGTSAGGVTIAVAAGLDAAGSGYFQADILYAWAVSYIYDGLQESNLYPYGTFATDSNAAISATAALTVTVAGADADLGVMDRRITGVKVYRAESSDDTDDNLGLFRLVETIDINTGTVAANWVGGGTNYTLAYTDNGGYPEGGATYEEETSIPETLEYPYTRYGMNEVGGGYHWTTLGDVFNESGDWTRYIFRSKKFRPNMFDWTSDFLVLPELPTALQWYNNYLYAFSLNKTYRINPELLIIEDVFEGVGCSNRQAIIATEFGMFFCNSEGAYRLANNQLDVISDPIYPTNPSISGAYGWKDFAEYSLYNVSSDIQKLMVHYIAEKRCVLFIGQFYGVTKAAAFAFYLPTQEWYWWDFSIASIAPDSGAFTGKDGEVYYSNQTATYELLGGATYRDFDWTSKEFNGGEPSQNKSWNKLIWDSSGTVVCKYNTNGGSPLSGTTATSGNWINTYKKTFQFYLDCTTSAYVDSVDIIVRRLYGKR